ncbi:unnamed protein product [Rodentolepis nana]|uniref:C2H2-type domain-containing protein n=1 Tax=Rodentolepis nana TaxID=102285 RepID=A0A0R3T7S6_RODNA|nr:unnamed protein product [Rodentolepis nana]
MSNIALLDTGNGKNNDTDSPSENQTDPRRRFTFISDWPHLTTRGWYRCQLCSVYECRREEFERHLRSEAHKIKRRTAKDCGQDDASAYFCDGENEQHSLETDIQ